MVAPRFFGYRFFGCGFFRDRVDQAARRLAIRRSGIRPMHDRADRQMMVR